SFFLKDVSYFKLCRRYQVYKILCNCINIDRNSARSVYTKCTPWDLYSLRSREESDRKVCSPYISQIIKNCNSKWHISLESLRRTSIENIKLHDELNSSSRASHI